MMTHKTNNGTVVASASSHPSQPLSSLTTVDDLLKLVPQRTTSKGPALHSAASTFVKFLGSTAQDAPLHSLETELERFVLHLKERRYNMETIKSYRYCINILIKIARQNGWEAPAQVMPPSWVPVFALARDKVVKSIIRFAISIKKVPSTFSELDLTTWSQEGFRAGRSLNACREALTRFRKIMSAPELVHLHPLVKVQAQRYGVSLKQMHPSLRAEVETLLKYRTGSFEPDRDGPPIGEATARMLRDCLVLLVGFAENIRGEPRVESLSALITRDILVAYIKWGWTKETCKAMESIAI